MLDPKRIDKKKTAAPKRKTARAGAKPAARGAAKKATAAHPSRAGKRSGMLVRSAGKASAKTAEQRDGKRILLSKPILRKPAPRSAVDVGIGAVEIAPPKDAPRTIGIAAAEAAMDKKAFDVVVLDVRGISGLCDEMVVASARSVTHLSAVCDGVEEALRKQGERVLHTDGRHSAEPDWILLDYGDLMVHLFRPEARQQTRLEDYYASARLVAKWKNDL